MRQYCPRPKGVGVIYDDVVDLRSYFSEIGLWPNQLALNPRGWMTNFSNEDLDVATALLRTFVYMNQDMIEKLSTSAYIRLSALKADSDTAEQIEPEWARFSSRVLISHPVSIPANSADSGHMFVRVLRDHAAIDEGRILNPDELAVELHRRVESVPVVFADDFSGTGTQFLRTLNADRPDGSGGATSIAAEVERLEGEDYYYVPAVISHAARIRVNAESRFRVSAGNVLPESASALHPRTYLVPAAMRSRLSDFIAKYSDLAGIPVPDRYGYKDSALAIAFAHGVPNNSLPIFSWKDNGWIPLIARP
jgi:hypothetical protein